VPDLLTEPISAAYGIDERDPIRVSPPTDRNQMRAPKSGAVHSLEIGSHILTHADGLLVGDRGAIAAIRARLENTEDPTVAEIEGAAKAIAKRRLEAFVGCECDLCIVVVKEVR
jgi:hypothetical protein